MKGIFLSTLMLLTFTLAAQQRGPQTLSQLEESPAGSKILDYIEAANKGTSVSDAWIKGLFSPKLIDAAGMGALKGMTEESKKLEGKLVIYEANRVGMYKYKLKIESQQNGWYDMVFTFEENDPYRITGITLDSSLNGSNAKPLYPAN